MSFGGYNSQIHVSKLHPVATNDINAVSKAVTRSTGFESFDYFNSGYSKEVSDVNLYYRTLIEELERKSRGTIAGLNTRIDCLEKEIKRISKDGVIVIREFEEKLKNAKEERDRFGMRIRDLEGILEGTRAKNELLIEDLNQAKDQLTQKTQQVQYLESRLKDLETSLNRAQSSSNQYAAGETLDAKKIEELKSRLASCSADYEKQLSVKDGIIQELRSKLNSAYREVPGSRVTIENEPFANQGNTGTIGFSDGRQGYMSTIKKPSEDDALRKTLAGQLSQIQDLQSALDLKNAAVQDLNLRLANLQSQLAVAQSRNSIAQETERKQIEAGLAQKDEIIASLEKRLYETNKLVESLKSGQSASELALRNQLHEIDQQRLKGIETEALLRRQLSEATQRISQLESLHQANLADQSVPKPTQLAKSDTMVMPSILNTVIADKDRTIQEQQKLIDSLRRKRDKEDKKRAEMYQYVNPAPKIERVPQPTYEIQYEQDPYILQENHKLSEELKKSLVSFGMLTLAKREDPVRGGQEQS